MAGEKEIKNNEGIKGFTALEIFSYGGTDEIWGIEKDNCKSFSYSTLDKSMNMEMIRQEKNKINNVPSEWNYNKKYTNIYEFIHTNISNNNESISKLKPVSRAFYKLIEILNATNILRNVADKNIKTFNFEISKYFKDLIIAVNSALLFVFFPFNGLLIFLLNLGIYIP